MQQLKSLLKSQKTWIVLLLILTGVFFYIRSVNRNLISDEVTYFYVFNEDGVLNSTADFREIETCADIYDSQINHYNIVNGRAIVHTVEQFFSGIIGIDVFYVLNVFVFIFTILIFIKIVFRNIYAYSYWIFAIVAFMYLFPEQVHLWISINLSLNYLWPMCLTLLVLYYWERLKSDEGELKIIALMPLLGFVAGWSHEAFSVSLSATTFLYYCFNYKKMTTRIAMLLIPLWIGSAILVFAPGNFVRLQSTEIKDAGTGMLKFLIQHPFAIKMLPLLLVILFVSLMKHSVNVKEFVKENIIWVSLLTLSFLFVFVVGVKPGRTYIAVELYSLILVINLVKTVNFPIEITTQKARKICAIITLLFVVHQSFVACASIEEKGRQDKFLGQYVSSPDGIAVYDYKSYGCLINPYIRHFQLEIGDNKDLIYYKKTLELFHTRRKKPLVAISSKDYNLISNFDKYVEENNCVKYSGPFYAIDGSIYAWALSDSVDENEKFEFHFDPVSFSDDVPLVMKFKRLIKPFSYPDRGEVLEINEVIYNSRKFLAIKIPPMRNVVDIKGVN